MEHCHSECVSMAWHLVAKYQNCRFIVLFCGQSRLQIITLVNPVEKLQTIVSNYIAEIFLRKSCFVQFYSLQLALFIKCTTKCDFI